MSNLDIWINSALCDKCNSGNDLHNLSAIYDAILFICKVFNFRMFSNPSFLNNKLIPIISPLNRSCNKIILSFKIKRYNIIVKEKLQKCYRNWTSFKSVEYLRIKQILSNFVNKKI